MDFHDLEYWREWIIAGNRLDQWVLALVLLLVGFPLLKKILAWLALRTRSEVAGKLSTRLKPIFILSLSIYFTTHLAGLVLPHILVRAIRLFVILGVAIQTASFSFAVLEIFFDERYRKRFGFAEANASVLGLLKLFFKILLLIIVVLTALESAGINVTTLVAGLGVGGIAVALAVQNVLGDLLASLAIVLDKPFEVGDFIVVGNYRGTIEKIGLKTTRIRALSGEQLVYSNSELLKSQIQNHKRMRERRVEFTVGVVAGIDGPAIARVVEIIQTVIQGDTKLRFERAHLATLAASTLQFEVVYWVKEADFNTYRTSHQAFLLGLMTRLKAEKIDLAAAS